MIDSIYSNKNELAKNIKQLRIINEKTLEFVSKHTGLSVSFLSQIEQGKRNIKSIDFYSILTTYNLSFNEYLIQCNKNNNNSQIAKKSNEILLMSDEKSEEFILTLCSTSNNEILYLVLFPYITLDLLKPFNSNGYIYCLKGDLIINLDKDEFRLKENDTFNFKKGDKIDFRNNFSNNVEVTINLIEPNF